MITIVVTYAADLRGDREESARSDLRERGSLYRAQLNGRFNHN